MSWIQQIDFMILEWIQSHLQGAALDLLMPMITALGNGGWLFILLALVLLLSKRYRRQGCALAVSLLLCLLVGNLFLKPLFARLRPCEVAGLSELLNSPPTDYYFPTGHTQASFTLDTYTHVTGDMQKRASETIGGFMENIMVR